MTTITLPELPSEILCNIALHIPSAYGITRLAQTCRRIYKIIAAEESWLFRAFIQDKFPAIQTPPFWKDAACALTSRSRAVDRLGIVGRFVILPETITRIGIQRETRRDNPTMGYRPPIDSYEAWNGGSWADKKEVLAWGAGEKLLMRTKQSGKHQRNNWVLFNDVNEPSSHDDILGLHLLEPEHGKEIDTENVIFGRRQGDIRHIALSIADATYDDKKIFRTQGLELNETDLINGSTSIMCAQFLQGSTALYHTDTDEQDVQPFAWIRPERSSRGRKSKLLSSSRIAVATMDGKDSLVISRISPDGLFPEQTIRVSSLDVESKMGHYTCQAISAIEPLNYHPLAGSPGDVFLAAWGDRTVRLHDLRSPRAYEGTYEDPTDDNFIYSVRAFGHDRFLIGSGGNALIKLFDLRCTSYSYLEARGPQAAAPSNAPIEHNQGQYPSKDFNIFLSAQPPPSFNRHITSRPTRMGSYSYRGPIYSMSTPSPSSPTVYTGIAGGLIRLDFASTDDLTGPVKEWYDCNLDLGFDAEMKPADESSLITVAGYERPDPDDLTTTSKLRKQHGSWNLRLKDAHRGAETGWDRRWEALEKPGAWRRQDG
ncbi:uncharacterized protein N7482_008230 [Penicillium canariense]|uniref:F-box domain-containing protein n=1 Tax=Penicillium canariense TaxID=189055 RepID=A0A9W9HVL5_9EURO|nr:uncharacterized protein N7482_008230 [Penicillium canariense]KAJ5157130.1 hypothetical protein N7482_008230 [Penicillium canariense]